MSMLVIVLLINALIDYYFEVLLLPIKTGNIVKSAIMFILLLNKLCYHLP